MDALLNANVLIIYMMAYIVNSTEYISTRKIQSTKMNSKCRDYLAITRKIQFQLATELSQLTPKD